MLISNINMKPVQVREDLAQCNVYQACISGLRQGKESDTEGLAVTSQLRRLYWSLSLKVEKGWLSPYFPHLSDLPLNSSILLASHLSLRDLVHGLGWGEMVSVTFRSPEINPKSKQAALNALKWVPNWTLTGGQQGMWWYRFLPYSAEAYLAPFHKNNVAECCSMINHAFQHK